MFINYRQALDYIEQKSKEYGSKNKFYTSEEYRNIYPILQKLYSVEKSEHQKNLNKAMRETNVKFGDKVFYDFISPFCFIERYTGTIVKYKNTAYVKLDQATVDGRKIVKWHKGWKKIMGGNGNEKDAVRTNL